MKKFLEQLKQVDLSTYNDAPSTTEGDNIDRSGYLKYSNLIGRSALYINKGSKESRPVVISQVYKHFVLLEYNNYGEQGMGYPGKISVSYTSLRCGEEIISLREGNR